MRRVIFGRNKKKAPINPVFKYNLNGDFLDTSGNNRNGIATATGFPTFMTGRKIGTQSAYFAGNKGFKSPVVPAFPNGASISFWIKAVDNRNIFINALGHRNQEGLLISIIGGKLTADFKGTNIKNGNKIITDNMWHHVVVLYNSTVGTSADNNLRIWIDGEDLTTNTSNNVGFNTGFRTPEGNFFGATNEIAGYYIGYLSEAILYARILTPAEILTLYTL